MMAAEGWWERYVGLPWKLGGRDRKGLDCWGLARLVLAEQRGILLPSWNDDPDAMNHSVHGRGRAFRRHLGEFERVPDGQEEPFDIATLFVGKALWHVGVLASKPSAVLHIEDEGGSLCEDWRQRPDFVQFGGFWRAR